LDPKCSKNSLHSNRYTCQGNQLQNASEKEGYQRASEEKKRKDTENAENERLRNEQQRKAASEKKKVLGLMIELNCGRVAR
jgi:hypothetical protein